MSNTDSNTNDTPESKFKSISDDDLAKLIPTAIKKEAEKKVTYNKKQEEYIKAHKTFLQNNAVQLGASIKADDDSEGKMNQLLAEEMMSKQKFANQVESLKYQFFGKPWMTL